jgi:hypothetical protein
MTNDVVVIRFKSDYSITLDTIEDGIVSTKSLSTDELEKALQSSMIRIDVNSGVLPQNCVSWAKSAQNNTSYYVIWHDEEFADIQYHETKYPHFPIPRFVFGFKLNGDKVQSVNIGIIAQGEITENTKMYRYPFSNVNGFSMCMGGNPMPKYKKRTALSGLPYYILGIPNNDDNYSAERTKLKLGYRELLEHLKDKSSEYYYTDVLIPNKKTLKDFI